MEKMRSFVDRYLAGRRDESLLVADLGSQDINGSYRDLFDADAWRYVGLDMAPGNNVDTVFRTPYQWRELASDTIDVLVSGQAFEHIRYTWITMLEVARVLKPGGLCCIVVPSSGPEHRYPEDCWRFYPDGMRALADFARLQILAVELQGIDSGCNDDSDQWRDCMLVCRKPDDGWWGNLRQGVRRWLQHRAMTWGLSPRVEADGAGSGLPAVPAQPAKEQPVVLTRRPSTLDQPLPSLEDCNFYHTVDLPSGGVMTGQWDLRAGVDEYLGKVPFEGRSVLEIGPASGFLTFHMEAAGARVTALEPPMAHLWDCAPCPGFDYAAWRESFSADIAGVRNAFRYLHHMHGSRAQLIVDDLAHLPESTGPFDIGVAACVLLHCRSPLDVLQNLASHVTHTMIVTDLHFPHLDGAPICQLVADARIAQVDTWWAFSPTYIAHWLQLIGFPHTHVSVHRQKRDTDGTWVPMFTVVATRQP